METLLWTPYFSPTVDHRWVDYLAQEIKSDRFMGDIHPIWFGVLKGRNYLVNGQHILRAVIAAEKSISVGYESYECETVDDLRRLRFLANYSIHRFLQQNELEQNIDPAESDQESDWSDVSDPFISDCFRISAL